jgi:D-alanine-D-alanine ligase
LRVAVVFDTPYRQYGPADHDRQCALDLANKAIEPDQEYQLGDALRKRGHDVTFLGIRDDVVEALSWLRDNKVDVVFNAAESFRGRDTLDYLVPALLEAENIPFTGSPPQSLMVTRNKAISKKVLRHHGLSVPDFRTYRTNERVDGNPGLRYPCIVKPLSTDGSMGISQASIVRDLEQLTSRVDFVIERWATAIVEEFVEGRELYVGVVGNGEGARLLPILELVFDKDRTAPEERIATVKAKWDDEYRAKMNIRMQLARPLSQKAQERIAHTCRVAYSVLGLRDYGRLDLRVDPDDAVWILEANANPYLSRDHEVAMAAEKGGIGYEELIETIASEAIRRSTSSG